MYKLLILLSLVVFCNARHLPAVCGSDGNTYQTAGHLLMYNNDYGTNVYIVHNGPCDFGAIPY